MFDMDTQLMCFYKWRLFQCPRKMKPAPILKDYQFEAEVKRDNNNVQKSQNVNLHMKCKIFIKHIIQIMHGII